MPFTVLCVCWPLPQSLSSGLTASTFTIFLLRVFMSLIKHHDQKQPGKEDVISLAVPQNRSSSKAARAGTHPGQEPMPRRGAAYWLAPGGWLAQLAFL